MKKILLKTKLLFSVSQFRNAAVACTIFAAGTVNAQCPAFGVTLSTQAQVNAFPSTYPGCTQLTGDLFIGINSGTTDITNLTPLANVTAVGGDFGIYNNPNLASIAGVNNITTINGYLRFTKNPSVTNINELSNLTSIGKDVKIEENNALTNLNGLSNLDTIGGYLEIKNNDALTNLNGLSSLGGIGGALEILYNDGLTNLNGLNNLTSVEEDIYITNNAILSDISDLINTTFKPAGTYGLTIRNNPALSLCNLPNFCTYLGNPAGTHPRDISGNATNCVSEQAITAACQTPTPCPTGDVTLATQAEVNAFGTNYSTCNAISGNLFIGVNSGTSDITDLSPLAGVQSVSGYVWLANNSVMQNLNGLHNISNIGGALNVTGNAALQNLNGLSSLTTLGQDIYLTDNNALTDISALQNTSFVPANGYGLTLSNNAALEVCNYPNFCAYIANDATTHPRIVVGNATTCATEQALQAACVTIGINDMGQVVINAYPNPVKDVLNISTDLNITEVAVMNMLGQSVISKAVNTATTQIDMAALPTGNYIIKVTTANGTQVGKVAKQ